MRYEGSPGGARRPNRYIHGYPWISTLDIHGYPWIRKPLISMDMDTQTLDIHGYLWISMDIAALRVTVYVVVRVTRYGLCESARYAALRVITMGLITLQGAERVVHVDDLDDLCGRRCHPSTFDLLDSAVERSY